MRSISLVRHACCWTEQNAIFASAIWLSPNSRTAETLCATLFCPEFDQAGARDNLRRTLSELVQTLEHNWLAIDHTTIRLRSNDELAVDVTQFESLLAACQRHGHPQDRSCPVCLPLLQQAVNFYRDDFLAGFTLADSPAFDDWQAFTAQHLRAELASALERLVDACNECGAYDIAIDHARRWVALDPLYKPAHHRLMLLYAQSDQLTAALRQ